ncbi:MAG: RsmE family RNA methyltransferase [Thermoanaerobaculia bacterium]
MITHLATAEDLAGSEIEIAGSAYRHLFRARRLATGERLRVVDGRGSARWGKVVEVDRHTARVALGEPAPSNEPRYRLDLVVAALRVERASWLVEKATEIGVRAVRFVSTRRTPRKYGSAQLERLRRVAAAAVAQCHRSRRPEITGVDPWDRVAEMLAPAGDRFFLDPEAAAEAAAGSRWRSGDVSGVMLVGPEGGWSSEEQRQLEGLGCVPVGLGARTLRTETAAIAAAVRLLLG